MTAPRSPLKKMAIDNFRRLQSLRNVVCISSADVASRIWLDGVTNPIAISAQFRMYNDSPLFFYDLSTIKLPFSLPYGLHTNLSTKP